MSDDEFETGDERIEVEDVSRGKIERATFTVGIVYDEWVSNRELSFRKEDAVLTLAQEMTDKGWDVERGTFKECERPMLLADGREHWHVTWVADGPEDTSGS